MTIRLKNWRPNESANTKKESRQSLDYRDSLCGWRDSNPHTSRYQILSLARLPITPQPLAVFAGAKIHSFLGFARRNYNFWPEIAQILEIVSQLQGDKQAYCLKVLASLHFVFTRASSSISGREARTGLISIPPRRVYIAATINVSGWKISQKRL